MNQWGTVLDNHTTTRRVRSLNRNQLSALGPVTVAKVLDEIRRAIEQSGVSRYRISQETGIDQGQLSKLMAGEAGLSIASLERLADYLDLELVIRPKSGRKRSK